MSKRTKEKLTLFETNPELEKEWNWLKNNELNIYPTELTKGAHKKVWWNCKKGHEWEDVIGNRTSGCGCPICSNHRIQEGFNDLYTLRPDLRVYFENVEYAKKIAVNSNKNANLICPDCFTKKVMKISDLSRRGFSCHKCGKLSSRPEKIIVGVLNEVGIDFIKELGKKDKEWIQGRKRYDFYFKMNNEEFIIETHGAQHYRENTFVYQGGRTLEEEQENDRIKKELALNNGIKEENYIVLDCRNSELEWIKNSILNSRLNDIFDLSSIDWIKINEFSVENKVKTVCNFYNNNKELLSNGEIAKELGISFGTLISYLKSGNELGWTNYAPKGKRKVICVDTKMIFDSINEAVEWCGLKGSAIIIRNCKGIKKSAGKHPDTKEPLHWLYLEDYELLQNEIIGDKNFN